MQILITYPEVGAGTAFVLADDTQPIITATTWPNGAGGTVKEGFLPDQERNVQLADLLRADYKLAIPRLNLLNRLQFTVQRTFTTTENCISFLAFHGDSVPAQGEVTLDNQSSTGRIYRYQPNAIVQRIRCVEHKNVSCVIQYSLVFNGAWQSSS